MRVLQEVDAWVGVNMFGCEVEEGEELLVYDNNNLQKYYLLYCF